jgi:hypothetical protein
MNWQDLIDAAWWALTYGVRKRCRLNWLRRLARQTEQEFPGTHIKIIVETKED